MLHAFASTSPAHEPQNLAHEMEKSTFPPFTGSKVVIILVFAGEKAMFRTDPRAEELITEYQNKVNHRILESKYGLRYQSIPRMMKRWGIPANTFVPTTAQIALMIQQYNTGQSSEKIAKQLGCSSTTVLRALAKAGVQIRPGTLNHRKHKTDTRYFQTIDCEAKAYFLGLLYADGHISKRGSSVSITQEVGHIDILEELSKAVYYGVIELRHFTGEYKDKDTGIIHPSGNYVICDINSKEMNADLTALGCTAKKSHTITFPTFLREDLYRHFIRGFVDGDGCISITESCKTGRVDITSNELFLTGFRSYIEPKLGITLQKFGMKPGCKTNTRNVQIKKHSDLLSFLHFLYDHSTISLKCKREKYEQICNLHTQKALGAAARIDDIRNYSNDYVPEINGIKLTKENVLKLNDEEKIQIEKGLFEFYRDQGFPYFHRSEDQLFTAFKSLTKVNAGELIRNDGTILTDNRSGIELAKFYSPHLTEVRSGREFARPTMIEAFDNDFILQRVIKEMLEKPEFHINGNKLRNLLGEQKNAYRTSSFFPSIAKLMYDKFSKEGDIIYDYSAGFGQRLTGAMALSHKITYVGVDPSERSIKANQGIYDFLKRSVPGFNQSIDLHCIGSEHFAPEKYLGKVNFAFSSTPYYDLEIYDNSTTQACYNRSYVSFVNEWWKSVVNNIDRLLTSDGILALNVAERIHNRYDFAEDMKAIVLSNGFELVETYRIRFSRNEDNAKYEPIFVFRKENRR